MLGHGRAWHQGGKFKPRSKHIYRRVYTRFVDCNSSSHRLTVTVWMVKVKAKASRKSYTEEDVQDAIAYLHSQAGPKKDLIYAANLFGVKYGTLRNRWSGRSLPAHKSQPARRYLTDAERPPPLAHPSSLAIAPNCLITLLWNPVHHSHLRLPHLLGKPGLHNHLVHIIILRI
jgi:hypothetical protein